MTGSPRIIDALDVVIPARNEETLLGACIESVLRSRRHLADRMTFGSEAPRTRIVVVLDSCTDGSRGVADAFGELIEVLDVAEATAGGARRRGFQRVLDDVLVSNPGTVLTATATANAAARHWICTTDADSVVPETWLASQLAVAVGGGRLALGRVRPDPAGVVPMTLEAWATADDAEHRPVHGANLGVRADVYLDAGGFSAVAEHEDVLLVRAVRERGHAVSILPDAVVTTSGRLEGRTPGGFAGRLRSLQGGLAASDPS